MTTAHRPTFDPARGKEAQRGPAYHQRLLPAHTHLKTRKRGQGGAGGLTADTDAPSSLESRDLRGELRSAEVNLKHKNSSDAADDEDAEGRAIADAPANTDGDGEVDETPEAKRRRLILEEAHDEDASSSSDGDDGEKASESSSDESSDEDDEAALRRELEKIKAERAAAKAKEDAARAEKEAEEREYDIARGNPLLNGDEIKGRDFGVKRRWDDDVVFKNQARGTEERERKRGKEFVNDALRSDFHRRFMSRYVR